MSRIRRIGLLLALGPLLAHAAVDDAGRTVVPLHTPPRIVSIAPGATEMLFAAGAGARVIAADEYSNEPPAARKLPRIGDVNAIDVERLVVLRPDVVVVWPGGNNPAQIEKIERLRIPIYRHRVQRLADLAPSIRRLGALAGTQAAADAAARNIDARLRALKDRYARRTPVRVLLQVWNRPIYTVGGTQLMSDALRVCGAENVFGDLRDLGPAVELEAVIARDPEVIIASAPANVAAEWVREWRKFPNLRAVRTRNVIPFDDQALSRLGPSVVAATEGLCKVIDSARARTGTAPQRVSR